ncbi:MAG: hypothetical protein H7834_16495 [Magnetococcus sp. YQC-9]
MFSVEALQSRKFATAIDGRDLLANRTRTVTDGSIQHIYMGFAYPGSDENDPVWLIKRITVLADGSTATRFAAGEAQFTHAWSDHASLTYV